MHFQSAKSKSILAFIAVFVAACSDNQPVTGPQSAFISAPAEVVSLTASVIHENDIRLAWVAGDALATSFEIEREEQHSPGVWAPVATVSGTDSIFNDATASPDPVYRYRIRACNGTDCTRWRNSGRVRSETTPAAPTNLETFDGGLSTRHVQWTDNSTSEDRFEIQFMSSANNGVWQALTNAGPDQTSIVHNGFPQFDIYAYRVRACLYFVGCSGWAVSAPTDPVDVSVTNVTATWNGPSQVDLFWQSGPDNDQHTIHRRTLPDGAWELVGTTGGTSFSNAVPVSGGYYQYRIMACYVAMCATATATASTRPNAPTGLASPSSTSTSIDLTWFAMTNETRFELQRRIRQPGFDWTVWALVASPVQDDVAYTDVTAITAGVQHHYRLRACNPLGCSPWSNSVTVTPL